MAVTVGLLGPITGFGSSFGAKALTSDDIVILVGGVSVKVQKETLEIQRVFAGHDTATADVVSVDASFQPTLASHVEMYIDGVLEFAGLLQKHTKRGVGDFGLPMLDYGLECVAYSQLAERRLFTGTLAAGTLKSQVTTLAAYLTAYGVAVDPSMADGPTMPASDFENATIWSALNSLMSVTAGIGTPWFPRMSYTKVLSMVQVGTDAAPYSLTLAGRQALGDVVVETTREYHANKIVGVFGPQAVAKITDPFTGDGVTATFPLTHSPAVTQGYVTNNGVNETLGPTDDPDGPVWEFDADAKTLTRMDGAPAVGAAIELNYGVQMPFTVTTEDLNDQAEHGIIERAYQESGIVSMTTAENYVAAKLAAGISDAITTTHRTLEPIVETGQTITIELDDRQLDDDFLITEIRLYLVANAVRREVKAIHGMQFHATFRQLFKNWSTGGAKAGTFSGSTSVGPSTYTDFGGSGSGSTIGPAPFWVQYWKNGAFKSSENFDWRDESSDNLAAFPTTPSAPSVANTGSGSYAATLRYYKVQFAKLSGTAIESISDFGTSVSFTPSGSGTAAQITRPSSPGVDATHWRPLGSVTDTASTFVALSAWIALATTTFDDSVNPASYAHVGDDLPSADGTYTTKSQLALQTLSTSPAEYLVQMKSESGGTTKGIIGVNIFDEVYPGEIVWGAEYVNGQYIARSASCTFIRQSGADFFITTFTGQTVGSPMITTDHVAMTMNGSTSETAKGDFAFSSSGTSACHIDKIVLSDSAIDRTLGVLLQISDAISGSQKALNFQMGNTSRTIRFDGVGSAVTFT